MSSFFDAVRDLKHSGTGPKACPICGSVEVKLMGSLSGWLLPALYSCQQCGYSGSLVLELEEASEDNEN
jgi:predicted RNA-binding Zn-ribbon protein involved in translation (DUF1610 family)